MADSQKPAVEQAKPAVAASMPTPEAPKRNPAFQAMGLPNWKFKLPSRNWMIFFTIVGSWTGAWYYDRREKKRIQQKYCDMVRHLSDEIIPVNQMPRRVTIYLAAAPGDGLRAAREHFFEYVKPILAAGSMDWDVVEGKREGEVREGAAEKVRRLRRKNGEPAQTELEMNKTLAVELMRQRNGIADWNGVPGDLVIGRHTWKEYMRGIHEGWLGPLDAPPAPLATEVDAPEPAQKDIPAAADPELQASPQAVPLTNETAGAPVSPPPETVPGENTDAKDGKEKKEEEKKPKTPTTKPPYISTEEYSARPIPRSMPNKLGPSAPIAYPHILGLMNTPIRMYRFLTQRYLADEVGRQVAAAVLAHHRAFHSPSEGKDWEQKEVLAHEEKDWHKKSLARDDYTEERPWIDEMMLDTRITERMHRFELKPENGWSDGEV